MTSALLMFLIPVIFYVSFFNLYCTQYSENYVSAILTQYIFPMMEQNMQRLSDDLDWFCDKFDYRNKDADWRTSKDALPRGMQKAAGGYPADEPYTMDK